MKIGLFLGSFNPITVGHIAIASCVLNSETCDKVLFVVAKHNPWKKEEPASFDIRCKMIETSIKPFGNKCEVCRFEEEFEAPVFSYIPITKAIETYKDDEIFIICGTDTIQRIPLWKNFKTHIKGKVKFVEVTRGEGNTIKEMEKLPCMFYKESYYKREFFEDYIEKICIQRMDISSTNVRWMVSKGMNPYPYVTEEVKNIIIENNLYI
jgi:nicotinate-nucleotide adenylyltransferase